VLHEIDFGLKFGELSVQATQKQFSHHLVKLVLKEEENFWCTYTNFPRATWLFGEPKLCFSLSVMLLVLIFECWVILTN